MRTAFELKIWHRKDEQSCTFLLLWDDRKKHLNANLPYSKDVQKWYQRWRRWYYRFYQLPYPKSSGNSGQLNPGSGDLAHDLMEAETELTQAFQRWLGAGELRTIQQRIRDELLRLGEPNSAKEMAHQSGVDVFLACDSDEMARLPWEAWSFDTVHNPGALRIVRTVMDGAEGNQVLPTRRRKPRILAVLGDDPNLPLQEDWKAVRSLSSIANIERFIWQPDDSVSTIKKKFAAKICDRCGWDILFFAGHSDETAVTGGRLSITPDVSLSISEIEDYLTQARKRGLQLAIFNSCSGLSIANSLVALGLQVVVIREPIRNDVAQSLLTPLCQELAKHNDIHSALLRASQHLQSAEKFAYPSAHLLPSFFSPYGAAAYRIPPFGWRQHLQQWLPTKQEAIALGTVTLISFMVPVQDMLLNMRTAAQAGYRELTNQVPESKPPTVTLIAIDQQSLNDADKGIENFQIQPIDREYLGSIVDKLSESEAKVVGIDYFLDTEQPKEQILATSIRNAVQARDTWFIFATREQDQRWTRDEIAAPTWSLEGDSYLFLWHMTLPDENTCAQPCPFAYALALTGMMNQTLALDDIPQPKLQNYTNFQQELSLYLQKNNQATLQTFLEKGTSPLKLPYIIDFSIPPNQVYERIAASQFLSNSDIPQELGQKIIIVASDGYLNAEDKFPVPLALEYWCHSTRSAERTQETCPEHITGGELHAYLIHHLLNSHLTLQIPAWWIIGLSALIGKGMGLYLLQQSNNQRRYQFFILSGGFVGYGLLALQIYISASVLVSIFLPSVIFALYATSILQKKTYIDRL